MPADHRTLVIAEIGVNHQGSLSRARELVDAAARAGADIAKFQTFSAEALVTQNASAAPYQRAATNVRTQIELLRELELSRSDFAVLADHCRDSGIEFLSTAFDQESLDFLVGLGMLRVKIPSGDLTDGPALLHAARKGLPMLVSTGMATMAEVKEALAVIAFGMGNETDDPTQADLDRFIGLVDNRVAARVVLLHCVTAYPTPIEAVNLQAMDALRSEFGTAVGLSDHTLGDVVPIAAVARGAAVIEKHLTSDRTLPGPDHKASLEPDAFASMVRSIRDVEAAIGDGRKGPTGPEWENVRAARRSLVALQPIAAGELFSTDNVGSRRPGGGLSPMTLWSLLGQTSPRDYAPGDQIEAP